MPSVVLDTTIASLLHPRRQGTPQRALYEPELSGATLAISFQTVAELLYWAEESNWGLQRRAALDEFIAQFVFLPYTTELAVTWAQVMAHTRRTGRRLEAGDAWIASAAVLYQAPLLTHDKDFVDLGFDGLDVICHAK